MNDGMPNPDVWAIGDAAKIEDAPLPATAQGQCYPWWLIDVLGSNVWYQLQIKKPNILSKNWTKLPRIRRLRHPSNSITKAVWHILGTGALLYFLDPWGHVLNFCRKAIYDKPGQPGQEDGFLQKETGRLAWLLWRSAYFTMTLSIRNRCVVLDIVITYIAKRVSIEFLSQPIGKLSR